LKLKPTTGCDYCSCECNLVFLFKILQTRLRLIAGNIFTLRKKLKFKEFLVGITFLVSLTLFSIFSHNLPNKHAKANAQPAKK